MALISLGLIMPVSSTHAAFSFFKKRSEAEVAAGFFVGGLVSLVLCSYFHWNIKRMVREQQELDQALDDFIKKLPQDKRAEFDHEVAQLIATMENMTDEEIETFLASAL